MPTPHPTPNPVKTCSTFTLKGFSIRNAGGGSLRSRGLAIDVGRWTQATEGGGRGEVRDFGMGSLLGLNPAGRLLDPDGVEPIRNAAR
jgi:hypothetical protein